MEILIVGESKPSGTVLCPNLLSRHLASIARFSLTAVWAR